MSMKKKTAEIKTKEKEMQLAMSNCLKHNISVYVVHSRGNWYVEVNNDGTIKRYDKSIGTGNKLSSRSKYGNTDWVDAVCRTWIYWSNLINKNKS